MKIKQHLKDSVKTDTRDLLNNHLITTSRSWQKVGKIMSRNVAVIAPDESTVIAAKLMSEKNLSSIVVLDDNDGIVGILTEMDFLKRVTSTNRNPDKTTVSEIMSKPVETIGLETTVLDASIFAKAKGIKRLPVVDENGKLAGITTQTDLIQVLTSYGKWRDISEIMSTNVVEIDKHASIIEAIRAMAENNISCVVVKDDDRNKVVGIFSERDFLMKVVATQTDLQNTKIEAVMSSPVISIPPSYSVFSASRLMEKTNIHRLVVIEDNRLYGIVTQTDIFNAVRKKLQDEEDKNFVMLQESKNSVYTIDLNDNTIYVNPAFLELFKISDYCEFVNKPFLPEYYWDNPQDRTTFLEELKKQGGIKVEELALKTSCGEKIFVTLFSTLIKDTNGQICGSQGILYDVSAKKELVKSKQIEKLLRESESRYRRITKAVTDYIYTVHFDENNNPVKTTHSNVSIAVTGYSPEDFNSDPFLWIKMVHSDDHDAIAKQVKQCINGEKTSPLEHRIINKEGKTRWMRSTLVPNRDSTGKLISYDGLLSDITERKEAEQNLKHAKELAEKSTEEIKKINMELQETYQKLMETSHYAGMGEVATEILHNVGNILNSINVSTTIITEKVANSEAPNLKKIADIIRQHANDSDFFVKDKCGKQIPIYLTEVGKYLSQDRIQILEHLKSLTKNVEHIKDVTRMQQTYAKVSGVEIETTIEELIEDSIRLNTVGLKHNKITFVRDIQPLGTIKLSRQKVLQILVNLINNAKYALIKTDKEEKILTIRAYKHDNDRIRIEVIDNGIGITQENLSSIFRHGFTTKKHGHGFGLHSSATISKGIKGSLTAYSDGPDKGAKFILELPFKPVGDKQCVT